MSAGFTPGPWETRRALRPDNTGGYDYSIDANGKVLAEAFENVGYLADGTTYDRRPVAANARLIAAAPDLLEALVGAVKRLRVATIAGGTDPEFADIMLEPFNAALAKARGDA